MDNQFTNLLPPDRARALRRDYRIRLGVVVCSFATALTVIAAVLLVPSHLFLVKEASQKEGQRISLYETLSTVDEEKLSARLTALNDQSAILLTLSKERAISALISQVLSVPHPGVQILEFNHKPPSETAAATLTIRGAADTRNALRSYQLALQAAPFAASAMLPVSAYAKDSNIPFSVQVTLQP